MAKGRKGSYPSGVPKPSGNAATTRATGDHADVKTGGLRAWLRDKRPVLQFVGLFAILMVLFYAVFYLPPTRGGFLPDSLQLPINNFFAGYLSQYARTSGAILSLLGHDITVTGQVIRSPQFSVTIVRGCDAMEATALFVSAVIAFPVRIRRRVLGAILGVLALACVNLTRIVSLFYVGIHRPSAFDTVHIEIWQPAFIVLAITFWVAWAWWATRQIVEPPDANKVPA